MVLGGGIIKAIMWGREQGLVTELGIYEVIRLMFKTQREVFWFV